MDLRRALLLNSWIQLFLVMLIVALVNIWSSDRFFRMDLTEDRRYTLDLVTRSLMTKLDKPLYAKVYFTKGLQAPYNNHEQILIDKLEEMRAYSRGLMEIQVTDPTNLLELEEEAQRFGIQSIQYRYQSANVSELKKVYMGVALVYGDRQQSLPAISRTSSLEYELARAVRALLSEESRKKIGFTTGHGEPDLLGGQSPPLKLLRSRLQEEHDLQPVELGGVDGVPNDIDALFVIGPQVPLSDRALYQVDQYLMRGGPTAVFVTNTKPDMRTLRPQTVYHGLEAILGHYGVQVNRDVVVDRTRNGMMRFPVRQGQDIRQVQINYPLIPRVMELSQESVVVKDLDSMLFPFVSSIDLADPMPPDVTAEILASSSDSSGRIKGIRTIDPGAFQVVAPGEERGEWPVLVALNGAWSSYFANQEIPDPAADEFGNVASTDPASKLRMGSQTRLIVSGSADFVANNVPFMLNLADWMLQDSSLISIRSKSVQIPALEPFEPEQARLMKGINLLGGALLLLLVGGVRWGIRRRGEAS